jgi:hypothetical protein
MSKNTDIDLSLFFTMDKSIVREIRNAEEEDICYWLTRPVEERYYAVEFLRAQWIQMNNLPTQMDRSYFEYR